MRHILLIFIAILFSWLHSNAQKPSSLTGISINHVPIVVADLVQTKSLFSDLGFKVKNGREHVGINNCFIKFQDGTYLEFTTPLDCTFKIGKFYTHFLKKRQGGTSLAVDINETGAAKNYLNKQNIHFSSDSNSIWQTINPEIKDTEIFFIEYADKIWKDSKENTTHPNTALLLNATYFFSTNVKEDIKKYTKLGFEVETQGKFLNINSYAMRLGRSKLILLDAQKSNTLYERFSEKNFEGICGFSIKVSSLDKTKAFLKNHTKNLIVNKNRLIIYFADYNFFFEFYE